jgi:peptidoglycan/LPS O-acetylase OafA/YrhL
MNWIRAFDLGPQGFLGHTWSLAIEEQFYFIWPIVLLWISPFGRVVVRGLLCISIVSVVVWRIYLWKHGANVDRLFNGSDTRADALLIGCLLACTPFFVQMATKLWPFAVALLTAETFSLPYTDGALPAGLYTLTAIASASVISALVASDTNLLQRALQFRPLVALGEFSYGFYLWHVVFILSVQRMYSISQIHFQRPVTAAIALLLTLITSWISFKYIEKPLLKLGRSGSRALVVVVIAE